MNSLNENIVFENVEFRYDDKRVFKNLNLEINKEDFIGISWSNWVWENNSH